MPLRTALVPALLLILAPATRAEEPPHEAWHFTSDATRHARVDDRGGLGEGFSFSVEYDPSDGNSEDYCPHCRFNIFTCDPGIDLADLTALGVKRSQIDSAAGLVSTLQSLAAKDPTGLAKELAPALSDADLTLYAVEIAALLDRVIDVVAVLDALAKIPTGTLDVSTDEGLYALIDQLHLKQDSAFMAAFSDPNDPRVHNSGVAVFSLANLLGGLANKGVPDNVRQALESAIANIPGMSGGPELSGDDDDVTKPASYHGYHTDLSVKQRTYAVNGASAYLMTFEISNDTTRVIPFVEAAFIADFDIPPSGYDTSTDFDPLEQALMLYDTIDYTDPLEHRWFGIAPAKVEALPTPGSFSLANYTLDKNFTLPIGAEPSHLNRYRFFLGDPHVVGDHDDAVGKSEKTGGLSFVLNGPLLPGDTRTIAFCYAVGQGTSSGTAKAAYKATMTACKALYTTFNPSCGDGILGYGEDCEVALSAPGTCTPACQTIKCGDGRVTGDEQCDDGNTDDGDGCSSACVSEVCGNGIVQLGEQCDDGNADNSDGCLTTCKRATCGDGALQACVGAGCQSPCGDHSYCFAGSLRVNDLSSAVNTFATLYDEVVPFVIGFDVNGARSQDINGVHVTTATSAPIDVTFTSTIPLAQELAAALTGKSMDVVVSSNGRFDTSGLVGVVDGQSIQLEVSAAGPPASVIALDGDGNPKLGGVVLTNARLDLRVQQVVIGPSNDTASGVVSATLSELDPSTVGELCDDGNTSDFDACTSACVPGVCGDGFVQPVLGEECDEGPAGTTWCVDCKLQARALCGNGTIDEAVGETCDDSNTHDDDGCSHLCRTETCGDGIVQANEQCDDGKNGDGDGCTDACMIERCGDHVVQPNEACDDGADNADTAACTTTCELARCGDGHIEAGVETCDDGNTTSLDGCSAACETESCGDGRPGPDEGCDDGNLTDGDGCSAECVVEYCGDGKAGPNEQCDDANTLDGDGCSKDCQLENPAACGNGKLDVGEQCDDGAKAAGDGCDAFCQFEDPAACGNGTVDPGEGCDDGNLVGGDGCTALCAVETCGDGFQQVGEGCDDGNTDDGDGCSASCQSEPSDCGNGQQEYGEQCDDGNDQPGDGCTPDCVYEGTPPLGDTCGNGMLDPGEQCDDGGRQDGNGCGATCQLEAAVCGNGRLERGEVCDDGNADPNDGCDACALPADAPQPRDGGCHGNCADGGVSLDLVGVVLALLYLGRRTSRRAA